MVKFYLPIVLSLSALKCARFPFLAIALVLISSWGFVQATQLPAPANRVPFSHPSASR